MARRRLLVLLVSVGLLGFAGCGGEDKSADVAGDVSLFPDSGGSDSTVDSVPDTTIDLTINDVPLPDLPSSDETSVEPDVQEPDLSEPDATPPPDVPPPAPDGDQDGVPDEGDLWPSDPNKPGMASIGKVYAHTSDELFSMDIKSYAVISIGKFKWPADLASHQMTDIAIDRFGVLYGVSFDTLYICSPINATCWNMGDLPSQFNGLTAVPKGVLSVDEDVLVGVSNAGGWYKLVVVGGQVQATSMGSYGGDYTSSGDAYAIKNLGAFASVNSFGAYSDWLVEIDPANGKVIQEIGQISDYSEVFGLAGWTGRAFAFDSTGDILVVDTSTGSVELAVSTNHAWWGAGVRTEIDLY